MKNIAFRSLRDIVSGDVIWYIIKVGILSAVLVAATLWNTWAWVASALSSYPSWLPSWDWLQSSGTAAINFFLAYALFVIYVSIMTSLTSEKLLIKIAQKHYPDLSDTGTPSVPKSILINLKSIAIFLVFLVPSFILFFVPIIGQIVMVWLWSILINKPTNYEVSAIFKIKHKIKHTRKLSLLAALFNYVPVLNLFTVIFAQIMFMHSVFVGDEKYKLSHQ